MGSLCAFVWLFPSSVCQSSLTLKTLLRNVAHALLSTAEYRHDTKGKKKDKALRKTDVKKERTEAMQEELYKDIPQRFNGMLKEMGVNLRKDWDAKQCTLLQIVYVCIYMQISFVLLFSGSLLELSTNRLSGKSQLHSVHAGGEMKNSFFNLSVLHQPSSVFIEKFRATHYSTTKKRRKWQLVT